MRGARESAVRTMRSAGIPEEVVLGTPKLTLSGMNHMTLENHQGIIECGDDTVRVRTGEGILCVKGKGLTLAHLRTSVLIVEGDIEQLFYQR